MKQLADSSKVFVTTTALTGLLIAVVMLWRLKKKQRIDQQNLNEMEIPSKWTKVGEIGKLIIYPLKGGKRKCLVEACFTKLGLEELKTDKMALQDRVFMVYNDKLELVNLKKNTNLLLVETAAEDESRVRFSFPDKEDLVIEIPDNSNHINKIDLYFGDSVKSVDCGDKAASWFSQVLTNKPSGLRLGCFVKDLVPLRSIDNCYEDVKNVYTKIRSDYLGAFADIASYMLMGEESLMDLNSRLEKPVTEHNFRPNIVVKGSPAYSEDNWDWVRIGDDVILRCFKYCTRCAVISINPDTAERDVRYEPLKTLRTYRQVKEPDMKKVEGNSPVMGLYLGCHKEGSVQVGDPVYINTQ